MITLEYTHIHKLDDEHKHTWMYMQTEDKFTHRHDDEYKHTWIYTQTDGRFTHINIQTQVRMEKKQKAMVARAASEPWANGSSSGEVACH